jgi:hypothetical protein
MRVEFRDVIDSEPGMSFVTIELALNLGGRNSQDSPEKCKTGGSYICSGPTRGCDVPMHESDIEARTCIGTSFNPDAIKAGPSGSPVTPELVALRAALVEILTNHSK